jgi:putative CocE/NonD family hydrolase
MSVAGRKGVSRSAVGGGPDGGPVRRIDHLWIPLSDGTRLAARVWLPAADTPVPAILEAIPYRKNDVTSVADETRHAYFAAHGYASVRVDIRGSGDSDGILLDEYVAQEQDDAVEVIAWLADQSWCDGQVGMIGYSWGGFAALQVAARRPPALKTIITVASTDDRYADDVHYMGGCVLAYYMLSWATTMHLYASLPPDPAVVGDDWRAAWLERLAGAAPMIEPWLSHQRRDEYWKHGSVCEDWDAIRCPVYAVGGWADGYRSAVFRLLEHLRCPRKGLIGPWSHHYPHDDIPPGPAIGFLQECLRWWDHWMKGADTGMMEEPMLRVWMMDPVEPRPSYDVRPGSWVAEPAWPSPNVDEQELVLGADGLGRGGVRTLQVRSPESTGVDAGDWDPFGNPADLPPDQRAEDGRSLVFDTLPLDEPLAILGQPAATLELQADRPLALVAVRLCDVAPDGASTLITRGLLNLTHRDDHEHPRPLDPGAAITVRVAMKAIGQVVPAGHRLRLAVSQAYWPWAWPSPEPVTLTVHAGPGSVLHLPIRRPWGEDPALAPFQPAEASPPLPAVTLAFESGGHDVSRSIGEGTSRLVHRYPSFHTLLPSTGMELRWCEPDIFTIADDDPLSARVECERSVTLSRDRWRVRLEARSTMSADAEQFHVTTELRAHEGSACIHSQAWSFTIPRDHV